MQKILFNDKYGLTYEVLSGGKTQTRRIIPEASLLRAETFKEKYFDDTLDVLDGKELLEQFFLIDEVEKPLYHKGEVVAIAQSYETIEDEWLKICPCPLVENGKVIADKGCDKCALVRPDSCFDKFVLTKTAGWKNKLFVRPDLMPHQIRITGIRIQRLQDVSEEDCLKEGISLWTEAKDYIDPRIKKSVDELITAGITPYQIPQCWDCFTSPKEAYAALINKISGKGTWDKNPWIFVYDFKLIK